MIRGAAVLGTTAHVASKRGAAKAQQHDAAQQAAPPPAAAPHAVPPEEDPYEALKELKDLLEKGILTQAEFGAQKQKILGDT